MRKPRKRSFQELVSENKLQLLKDKDAIEKIEERLEERLGKKHLKEVR
ncbi:FbpB family small basic protein [Niallia sp. 01092]